MRLLVALALVGCAEGAPNRLDGSLADIFDLAFDATRARLYDRELSVEYLDQVRSGRIAVRVTLQRTDGLAPGRHDLPGGGHVGLADEVGSQLPPLVDGRVVLDAYDPVDGAEVRGTFRATFETADEDRLAVFGAFDTVLEVVDAR